MNAWVTLCTVVLTASLVSACGGGSDAVNEAVADFQPGQRFSIETPLLVRQSN